MILQPTLFNHVRVNDMTEVFHIKLGALRIKLVKVKATEKIVSQYADSVNKKSTSLKLWYPRSALLEPVFPPPSGRSGVDLDRDTEQVEQLLLERAERGRERLKEVAVSAEESVTGETGERLDHARRTR
jgi:hypothetical protein